MNDLNYTTCSIGKDFLYNLSEFANDTSEKVVGKSDVEIFGLGAVTAIAIVLIADVILSGDLIKLDAPVDAKCFKKFNSKNVTRTLLLALICLMLPFLLLFIVLAVVYKVLCSVVIRNNDKNFVEFLNSFDVFWSLEDDTSKSVINVLGIIESDSPQTLINSIKEKLRNISDDENTKKIFYRRNEKFGFYYWQKHKSIDMDKYVEVVDLSDKDNLQVEDLEKLMMDLQNESLPYEDEGLFKILITKQRVGNNIKERGEYGIVFRIHHSVGDGVALIELLCKTFADKSECCPVNMFSFPNNYHNDDSPKNLIQMMQKLCEMPICFVDGMIRKPDNNSLHGPGLLGTKVFKWTQSDENLLTIVKEIKDNVDNVNFSEVLLTGLSNGLLNYFSQKMEPIPEDVAVILPVRFPKTPSAEKDVQLMNDFSVTILDVPVEENKRFGKIVARCCLLRKSADPLTNYYFLKLVCSVFPKSILQPLLISRQATMVFSNLPGPETLSLCGGNVLKSLVFFVPHKGNTGLGVTALCYGGVLRFAAMADTALVSSPEDLGIILDGMVAKIHQLHSIYVK